MRKQWIGLLAVGLLAAPALAGSVATVSPLLGGTMGEYSSNGQLDMWTYTLPTTQPSQQPRNLYDNMPLTLGGGASPGLFGGFNTTPGTFLFVDWTNPDAQWGDDMHQISAGGGGPAVVTNLRYSYFNNGNPGGGPPPTVFTVTHIIKLYEMVPPSQVPPVTSLIFKGHLEASIFLPGLPAGGFTTTMKTVPTPGAGTTIVTNQNFYPYTVTVQIDPVILKGSALWIKFEELGPAAPDTFWLTGGIPQVKAGGGATQPASPNSLGIGYSNQGVTFTLKNYYPSGAHYNLWLPFDYFYFTDSGYVASNIAVGLNGFHIPAPAAVSLLGLGGLVALRRRRPKA